MIRRVPRRVNRHQLPVARLESLPVNDRLPIDGIPGVALGPGHFREPHVRHPIAQRRRAGGVVHVRVCNEGGLQPRAREGSFQLRQVPRVSRPGVDQHRHAPDHVAFWHAESRTLFCGDLAMKTGTVVIPAISGGDLSAYLRSLDRVLALEPARLLPAHGPVIDNPTRLLRTYIEHRREREAQVLAALGAGDSSADQIVARIYAGLAAPLVPMARESVTAHLRKLEGEGRVARDGDSWIVRRL